MAIRTKVSKRPAGARDDASGAQARARYILRIYVSGTTPGSTRALVNIRRICEEHLEGRYELEVLDILDHSAAAAADQVMAAPTLIKKLPLPQRRFVGDLSQTERILVGLGLRKTTTPDESHAR